jgi:S1-C subfamily serine protease
MHLLFVLLFTTLSFGRSVVPDRVITPNLDLFNKFNKTMKDGSVKVNVTTVSAKGEFNQYGDKIVLTKEKYEEYLKPSLAVFEMIPNQYHNSTEGMNRRGTAFHIGNNLVLTNNHVLDETFKNTSECSDFEVKDHSDETYACKKVHYCNPVQDFCLIEMAVKEKTKRDGCVFCRGTKYEVSLAQGPSLKLKASYRPAVEKWNSEILTAIGNSAGYGIHFSQGRGFTLLRDRTFFYAPITKGNSGGALLNSEGLVVGIVKQQTNNLISADPNQTYNIAVASDLAIGLLREALRDDPETLLKFNQTVVE